MGNQTNRRYKTKEQRNRKAREEMKERRKMNF
jgi:hypothetical protein